MPTIRAGEWTAEAVAACDAHTYESYALTDDAEEELDSLSFIFPEGAEGDNEISTSFRRVGCTSTCFLAVSEGPATVCLSIALPDAYPEAAPVLVLEDSAGVLDADAMRASCDAFCAEQVGEPVMYALSMHLQEQMLEQQ